MESDKSRHPVRKVKPKSTIMKTTITLLITVIISLMLTSYTVPVSISGTVTDPAGNPLSGVFVKSRPGTVSTITDNNGFYSIKPDDKALTLVFSLQGYTTVIEKIGTRSVINVIINPSPVPEKDASKHKNDQNMPMEARSLGAAIAAPYTKMSSDEVLSFRRYNDNFNTEGYSAVNENGFRNVTSNPLSTFSIDVDNASYSNIRRFINMGQMPPADAVRIEEMINYFKYDYPEPSGEHPFNLFSELAVCPWNKNHYLLQVGLKAKEIDKSSLPPSNIVFLIDVSGSMDSPNKLPLLKSAFSLLVNELRPKDKVAIVVYAGAAGLVLESTPGNMKEKIMSAIDNLQAGGSTAGGEGLRLAYAEAGRNFIKGGNNRIILATDGDFNVGESSNGGMERLVEQERERGVFITVLGFGMGNIKDDKMEIIADKGNGNYSYIDNLQEARKVLVREFGGTLFTVAKDVKLQIEFNPDKIQSYRLIGYENRLLNEEDFNDDRKDAGEMGSGHNVTALYELIPAGNGEDNPSVDPLRYGKRETETIIGNQYTGEYLNIKVRYKKPEGSTSILFEKPVRGRIEAINDASDNLKFAAAVAEFGMILRNSEFKGTSTPGTAELLAREARGNDEDGYRSEMIRLLQIVRDMKMTAETE